MEKIIFLDFDGVMNGHEWIHLQAGPRIGQRQVEILNRIISLSGAKLVISSTWSRHCDIPSNFEWMLRTHGCNAIVLEGINAFETNPVNRSTNILSWVEQHPGTIWVAIDDLPLTVKYHIRPNPAVGLTPVDVQNCMNMFQKQCG